ncbi:MAG: AAA family ATPase [Eubacterium sp.]|nr:AAA family ATPase [Eubacterium sp.]
MASTAALLNKCREICDRYTKFVPELPEEELFYQFCDDVMRMAFLVAASDGYVDLVETELISRTFGVHFDYSTLAKSYGLDYISEKTYLKQIPISIRTVAALEKRNEFLPNSILNDTRVLYETMKQFGNDILNCTGAKLKFSVMLQTYFINNILHYIFSMEEMDAISNEKEIVDTLNFTLPWMIKSANKARVEKDQASGNGLASGAINNPDSYGPGRRGNEDNINNSNTASATFSFGPGIGRSNSRSGSRFDNSDNYSNNVKEYTDREEARKSMESMRTDMNFASKNSVTGKAFSGPENNNQSSSPIDMNKINEILSEVDSMIGLGSVKKEIHDMVNMILINEMRRKKGLKSPVMSRHLVFTGNPGTGKTTIARAIGQIYKTLGILEKGHMIETDRSGLVAGYMGQTAEKVTEVVNSAMGGILFIDEAYSLVSDSEGDFGQEAINTLLKLMEDNRDNLVVIVAGYTEEMEDFINSNPGLRSRFNRYIQFNDYSDEELLKIFKVYVEQQDYSLEENSDQAILKAIEKIREDEVDNFGNARSVRNFFEKVINNQANRLMQEGVNIADADQLMLIKNCDLEVK